MVNLPQPPAKGCCFLLWFLLYFSPWPEEMTSCTSAYHWKGEGEGRVCDGAGGKVPILCWQLPGGWHLAPASVRPTHAPHAHEPRAGNIYFHGKSWWVINHESIYLKLYLGGLWFVWDFFKSGLPLCFSHTPAKIPGGLWNLRQKAGAAKSKDYSSSVCS